VDVDDDDDEKFSTELEISVICLYDGLFSPLRLINNFWRF
jgi:hypothetical protein